MLRVPPPNHRATERRTFDAPEYADASLTSWQPAAISFSSARRRTFEAWDIQRSLAGSGVAGRDPRHGAPARASARRSRSAAARTRTRSSTCPDERRGRDRRDRPRRQVDVPRAGTAGLLPDPRPQAPRQRHQAVRAAISRRRSSGRLAPLGIEGNAPRRSRRRLARRPLQGRSPRSASMSRAGSRRTATRSTSTSTRRRSPTGSRRAASRTRRSRRSRASSAGR